MRPIAHGTWQRFPGPANKERWAGQVLLALRNREPLADFMKADLQRILEPGSPGSANWMALDYAACYLHDSQRWRQVVIDFLRSQVEPWGISGWMAPLASPDADACRNELGDKGNHGGWQVFAVCCLLERAAAIGDDRVAHLCIRWLRMFARFNALQQAPDGVVVGPAIRSGDPSSPITDTVLAQLTDDVERIVKSDPALWRASKADGSGTAKGGVPYGIACMIVRELLLDGVLAPFQGLSDADLVPVANPVHIAHTTAGHIGWMPALEPQRIDGTQEIQPVAAAWLRPDGSVEHVYCRGKRRDYTGPWPHEAEPGIEIRGEIIAHWRGDAQGWTRLDPARSEPAPPPPPAKRRARPWWKFW